MSLETLAREGVARFIAPWQPKAAEPDGSYFATVVDPDTTPPASYWCIVRGGVELFRSRRFTGGSLIECLRSLREAIKDNPRIGWDNVASQLRSLAEIEREEAEFASFTAETGIFRFDQRVFDHVQTELRVPPSARWVRIINHSARLVTVRVNGDPSTLDLSGNRFDADRSPGIDEMPHVIVSRPNGVGKITASSEGSKLIIDWAMGEPAPEGQ